MIRVLHYGMGPNLGGIETYLWNLSQTVDRERFHFDFLHTDTGLRPAFAACLEDQGSRFFGVTPRRTSLRRNRTDLERVFSNGEYDILHFHINTASYVAPVRVALRHGTRVVVHSHNGGARSRVTRALHQANRRILPWHAMARIAVSGEAGCWMFGRREFELVHNGIDVDAFAFRPELRERTRRALGIAPETFVIGNVGAFLPAKNHEFILETFAEVRRRRPSSRLLLIGDGPLRGLSERRALELGVDHGVNFLGRRTDVGVLLQAMDVLLMPSRFEGFPIVAVEAQAAGLPCVLSENITGEVVVSQYSRRLSLDDPPSAWATRLLATDPEPDRSAGASAVRDAGFTISANTAAVQAVYERLIRS